jgi:ribosomal protein L7/L12
MTTEPDVLLRLADLERKVSELYKHLGKAEPEYSEGEISPEVQELVRQRKTIDAIKLYQEQTGVGLSEAKEAIDRLMSGG